jgi:PAS domain S-box-containing protein
MPSRKKETKPRRAKQSDSKKTPDKTKGTTKSAHSPQKGEKRVSTVGRRIAAAASASFEVSLQALRESEEKYRTLFNEARDGIALIEIETGQIIDCNAEFENQTGRKLKQLKKMKIWEVRPSEKIEAAKKKFFETKVKGTGGSKELEFQKPNGEIVPVEFVSRVVKIQDKQYIQSNVRDITERRQAEEALERELAVNKALAELSGALITPSSSIEDVANVVLDAAKRLTQSEHGYVSSIDPKTRDHLAHTLTKMMGKECLVRGEGRRIRFPIGADGVYPSLWGHAYNSREAFLTNAPDKHEASRGVPGGHIPIKNFLSVPAVIGEELLGQIALANSPGDYADRDIEAIKRLAELYAMAIQRKRAEEALKAEKEFTETALDAQTDTFFVFEPSTARAVRWNKAFNEISGYSDEEIRSMKAPDSYYSEEDLKKAAAAAEKVLDEGIATVELSLITKDGRSIPTEYTGSAIRDEEGNPYYIIAVGRDVTERRQAEKALRESEEKFRNLAEQSPNMIFINKRGRVVYANEKCEAITGYKREEFYSLDFDFLTLIAPEYRDITKANFRRHMMGEEAAPLEYALLTKKGRRIEAILTSKLVTYEGEAAILGIVTDITDRKMAEEALQKRTYELGERVKELNCLYGIADLVQKPGISLEEILKGTVEIMPPAFQYPEITCVRVVLEGRTFASKSFRETMWRQASDIIVHGDRAGTVEVYHLEEKPKSDEGPFLAEEKNLINAIAEQLGRITERRKAEEEIQKLNKSLRFQAAELAAANRELEAFSYSVSHDLRAPLRTVEGFSRALVEDYSDKLEEEGKDYLRRIRAATQHMGQLIDDLLNLSLVMRTQMHREEINLSELVRTIKAEFQETQPERQVEFVVQERVFAHGDARLLRAVLENLLGNAWKFTGKHLQAKIEFGAMQKGEQTVYFVRDDGAGFDMSYVSKLFVPFQRLHSIAEFPGNGIGLVLASRIINRHGGRIWAEGEVEKGATFYFTLE